MEYLLKRYGSLALSKRFWLHDPDHEVDASNLARWIKKRPGAASAWHLAEALRIDDQKTEPLRNLSSGLRPVLAKTLCAVTLRFHRTVG